MGSLEINVDGDVACGHAHTVVLVHRSGRPEVLSAGANSYGQLGLGFKLLNEIPYINMETSISA